MEKRQNTALSPQTKKYLDKINNVDVLVGIPAYNNAHTINYVVYQAAKGLETYFPDLDTAIFISDGHSTDGTLRAVRAMRLPFRVKVILTNYIGVSGKGSAVKAIFEAARLLKAKAVALVDSDLRSITPKWIKLLISPVLEHTGLVTPYYFRDKYDGTITNFLCYPVTFSLYQTPIRQPIGGDFGFSIELVKKLLESQLWQTPYVPTFGIDIFETHTALAKGFRVKQAFLGTKIHESKDPSKHLAPMFKQVVGSMFSCVEHYEKAWRGIDRSQEVEIIGKVDCSMTPESVSVDINRLLDSYRNNFPSKKTIYQAILNDSVYKEFEDLGKRKESDFFLRSEVWAKSVYSFAAYFKDQEQAEKEDLLEALRILWIGRVASYIVETRNMNTAEADRKIEEEVEIFQRLKPFLLDAFK